jgi:hypothetical protein
LSRCSCQLVTSFIDLQLFIGGWVFHHPFGIIGRLFISSFKVCTEVVFAAVLKYNTILYIFWPILNIIVQFFVQMCKFLYLLENEA